MGRGIGVVVGVIALAIGCARDGDPDSAADGAECVGAKCDALETGSGSGSDDEGTTAAESTGGDAEPPTLQEICEERRADALSEGRLAFGQDELRWSCADVPGTLPDERGQEYCEYFAIVRVPGQVDSEVLGMLLGPEYEDGHTSYALDLDGAAITALEEDPDAIVGQCVFTSWNADLETDCGGDCEVAPQILGRSVGDPEVFRMKLDANTREAAVQLVDDCMNFIAPEGDASDPDDPLHDPFMRACELNADINATETRKSDNVACAASVRLAECGCDLAEGSLPEAFAPADRLGFPLGGWTGRDELPSGCSYVDAEPSSHTIVACDLTALEVLDHADELKAYCQSTYADDVVVYVPVPSSLITCDPPTDETYASTCTEFPWVVGS